MGAQPNLRSLDVIVTSQCNLRCAYCYQNRKRPGRIAWRSLRPALDLLIASQQPGVRLLFIGGEPLLAFPLVRRAVRHVLARRPPRPPVEFLIATNGTLLGSREAAFLAEHDVDLQISFDGVEPAQRLRGAKTFAQLDTLLDRLRCEHPAYFQRRVSVAVTLTADTIPRLAESVRYFLGKGVPEIVINPAITDQPDWDETRLGELDAQFDALFRASLAYHRRTGLTPVKLLRRSAGSRARPGPPDWLCGACGGEHLAIDVDGQLTGCLLFARSYQELPTTALGRALTTLGLGSIHEKWLVRRLEGYGARVAAVQLFNGRSRKRTHRRRCATCAVRSECNPCPVSIVHQPGNEDPHRIPAFVCAFSRVAARYRRRFPPAPDPRRLVTARAPVPRLVRDLIEYSRQKGRTA
jgi:sulfatase maturation enzyme AslB (radical SAM superfamily)